MAGAGYTSMGAYSIHHADVFSFLENPAALSQLKKTAAGLYAERKFLLTELNSYTTAVGIKTSSGNFGITALYTGFAAYNETRLGLAYGRSLGSKLDVGATINYNSIGIANGYGSAAAISFELGSILRLTEKLQAGFHINNPVGGKFGNDKQEKLPAVYSFGIGYDAAEKFLVSTSIEKEEDQPVSIHTGFQYKLIPQLLVRAGMASANSTAWLGLGLTIRSLRLDITTSYHPQLGISPGMLLLFSFGNRKN